MSIKARTGHEITLTRDGNGRITVITDAFGRETKLFYITIGANTRLNEIREPAPGDVGFYSTTFQYDSSGRLIQITNALGEATRFEWDGSGRLSKAIDGHGHETVYAYDGSNRVSSITDPASEATTFTWNSGSTVVTDRESNATTYTIDGNGRCTKIADALSNETEMTWDSTSTEPTVMLGPKIPVSGTPWSRHKTIFTYGSGADLHEVASKEIRKITNTDSTGTLLTSEAWTYNTQHDVLTYSDPLTHVWTYAYQLDGGNSVGLVTTVTNPLTEVTQTNGYEVSGGKYRITTSAVGDQDATQFAYNVGQANSYGVPNQITTPNGFVVVSKIDIRGRAYETIETLSVEDSIDATTLVEFDALDRAIKVTYPDDTSTSVLYDCCHMVATIDENGFGPTTIYDKLGRVDMQIDPVGNETTYTYDNEGHTLTITDPRGKVTTFTYDAIYRVTKVEYPGGWEEHFTYWEPGMVKSKKNKKGMTESTVNYEYDDLYRLKKKDFPTGTDTEFEYDAASRLTKMKDASGEKRYTYDHANRLTKTLQGPIGFVENTSHNTKVENTWNDANQRETLTMTIRTLSAKTWTYNFSKEGFLDSIDDPDETNNFSLEYLIDGRLKKITLPNDATRELFYQDTDDSHVMVLNKRKFLRKTLDITSTPATICSFSYELDLAGRRLSVTDKDGKYTPFGLNPNGQLLVETKWSAKTPGTRNYQYAYAYDAAGNRIEEFTDGVRTQYTVGDAGQLVSAGTVDFTYDQFLNTSSMEDSASIDPATNFTWDFESNMVGVQYATGDPHADTHEYDGTGRRLRSKIDDATDWINFVYDEVTGNLIAEYSLISGTYSLSATYTWGAGLLKQQRGATKRFYHFDGSGNTSALTDGSQSITDTYSYNAFGVVISSSGSNVNPFRWLGQVGAYDDGSRGSASGLLFAEPTYVLLTYRIPINIRKQLGAPGRPSGPTNLEEWGKQMEKEIVQLVEDLAEAVSGAASGVTSWLEDIVTHLSDTALILVMLGKVSTSKAVYGDYCGPQSNMPPVGASGFQNPLDECCYNHDKAWAEAKPPCTVHDQCRSQCINATITLCKCLRDKRCGLLDFKCRKMQIIFLAYACNINTWCTVF